MLFGVLFVLFMGHRAERLRWHPFLWIAAIAVPAALFGSYYKEIGLARLGESANLFTLSMLATQWATLAGVWSFFYLLSFGAGKLVRRARKSIAPKNPPIP